MRRWLVVFLLMFVPLQLGWTVVAGYCQHESGAATQHLGHHDHQHRAGDDKDVSSDFGKAAGIDPDCASCHAGCFVALLGSATLSSPTGSSLSTIDYWAYLAPPPPERFERPRWHLPA